MRRGSVCAGDGQGQGGPAEKDGVDVGKAGYPQPRVVQIGSPIGARMFRPVGETKPIRSTDNCWRCPNLQGIAARISRRIGTNIGVEQGGQAAGQHQALEQDRSDRRTPAFCPAGRQRTTG